MGYQLTVNEQKFVADTRAALADARSPVEEAMAVRFKEITVANFGVMGPDRPLYWPRLSLAYARKVGREIATLVVSGALRSAVKQDGNNVSISDDDVPYATVHQFGGGNNIPARPYFPLTEDGEAMPWTMSQIEEEAAKQLNRIFE